MTRRWPVRPLVSSRDVGDAADPAVLDQLGDLRGQVVRVDLVRQLGDDQAGAALESSSTSTTARMMIEPRPVR